MRGSKVKLRSAVLTAAAAGVAAFAGPLSAQALNPQPEPPAAICRKVAATATSSLGRVGLGSSKGIVIEGGKAACAALPGGR